MSVVLLGFCITQIVFFAFENNHRDDVITAAPFIFFLTVCLFTAELIVRSLSPSKSAGVRTSRFVFAIFLQPPVLPIVMSRSPVFFKIAFRKSSTSGPRYNCSKVLSSETLRTSFQRKRCTKSISVSQHPDIKLLRSSEIWPFSSFP